MTGATLPSISVAFEKPVQPCQITMASALASCPLLCHGLPVKSQMVLCWILEQFGFCNTLSAWHYAFAANLLGIAAQRGVRVNDILNIDMVRVGPGWQGAV